ncbi:exo-beta-N-acetylmuramidase NamZ family protein [Prevotella sp.]|uniref:exo-beta-N-acetylmuramidase NamZ family protein n=1 Tax=Prevotella sp. TaxID=59823 RepID=UPI002F93FD7D
MKRIILLLLCFLGLVGQSMGQKVKTGIEVLKSEKFKTLEGKRVGLVTNPTGVDNHLRSVVDILHAAKNVNLVALFGPEHGVRGNAHAGDAVGNDTDPTTGLPVYSLYGKYRMPSDEMLKGIDVLVYDIQDIGCRSFTYISTLGNIMKAAARNHIKVVVLDRPNPLGGNNVEGCITEDDCISFVSQFKVPYVYGLTPGELALLLNNEGLLGERCDLEIVKMKGWKRKMTYSDTGLKWVLSSPHIPEATSAPFYAVSGIVGELDSLNIGVGYTVPFQTFAAPWIKAAELSKRMNALGLRGFSFRPIYYSPFYSKFKGQQLQGVQVYITNYRRARLCEVQFYILQELYKLYPEHDVLGDSKNRTDMFNKVCGSKEIRRLFLKRHRWSDVRDYWDKDIKAFKKLSKQYYLYK